MSEREYVVVVNKGVNLSELEAELTASSGAGPIPNRSVDIANARVGSTRMTHFMLTADEATELMKDSRVLSVEIPVGERTDIKIGYDLTQGGSNFRRSTVHTNSDVNWGLVRCAAASNSVYQNNVAPTVDYTTGIGGRGVDVVIQDSGLQVDHPDFFDRDGVTRVQQINWYTESGLSGTQSANHYRDLDGHGTHCASIAAGLTYGWAKAAHIYSQKLSGLEGTGDSGTGISIADAFDTIRLWHNAKTNGRPTVVNMSWGYSANLTADPTSGNYRGEAWVWNPPDFVVGYDSRSGLWGSTGVVDKLFGSPAYTIMPTRVPSVDAEIDDMIAAGIHVVIAAGNNIFKHDVPGGDDYDNTVVFSGTTYNYHRGSSPHSDDAGCYVVGNIDYHTEELLGPVGTDIISDTSSRGPAVNMLAPGTEIMAATSTTNKFTDFDYPGNSSFKLTAISGTSMAAPQVAGVIAQHLELFPEITPAQMQTRINADAKADTVYTTSNDTDYNAYTNSLMGSPNRMLYSKYNQQPLSFTGFAMTSGASSATYALSADVAAVNEGGTVTFTLTTTGLGDGVTVSYAISGIQSGDLSSGSLAGTFTITSNTATAAFTLANDLTTEGTETLTLSLNNGQASQAVTVNDTSVTPPAATYTLSSDVPNVNEGDTVTFTLTTTNVADATNIPYTITGVTLADIGGYNIDAQYNNGAIIDVTGDGSDFFKREVTVNGVRIMAAGGVGGQTAVPDAWVEKVARMFELFTDPNGAGINETYQRNLIKTLSGDTGTYHAGVPTIQRVARGAGADYSTNFLTDAGITFWNLTDLFDNTVQNDMVWYLNSTGDGYGDGDIDAQEVIEHVFHTLHMHGLPADDIKLYEFLASDWQSGDLYAAMEEAYDAGKWDPSGYQSPSNAWKTDSDAFEVAAKEYLFLLNFAMFEYTDLWEGGSLAPEWTDDMRTQAGIQSNNPLGYAFHNTYIATVISKPSLATIRSIFQDGNTPSQDNPALAGASGYVSDTPASLTGNFTITNNTDTLAVTFAEDSTTEGAETIRLSLDNGEDFHDVTVNDTSQAPVTPDPTYSLSGPASANEGDTVTVTLTTTNVDDATEVAYSVTGAIASDFTSGTTLGNFTVNNNTAQVSWTLAADLSTEGTEAMLVSLDNGEATHTINIQDTSRTPVYTNLLNDSGDGSINEGETVTFTLQGTNIPNGTTVPYTVTGISNPNDTDDALTGNLTMNSNTASVSIELKEDLTTEGAETLTFTLGATDSNGTSTGGLSINITVVDTSITFTPDYTISVSNSGNNYLLSGTDRSASFADASQPALTFNTGDKVQFVINADTASSHPFYIKTAQGTGPGNQASGTTGQGTGQLNWTVGSTGTYYYQCSIHNNMNNTITVNT